MWTALLLMKSAVSLQVSLVISPLTPPLLVDVLKTTYSGNQGLSLVFQLFPEGIEGELRPEQADVALDFTYSHRLSLLLRVQYPVVICMHAECPPGTITSLPSPSEYAEAVNAVMRKLSFTNVFLGLQHSYREISQELGEQHAFADVITLEANITQEYALNVVGKVVKPRGTNLALFLVDSAAAAGLVSALATYNLWRSGFVYIFLDPPNWHLNNSELTEGTLYISDQTASGTNTWEEAQRRLLEAQIIALSEAVNSGVETPAALLTFFNSQFGGKPRQRSFMLSNILSSNETISQSFSHFQTSLLRYPGHSSQPPASKQAQIPVSINSDGHSFDGSDYPYMRVIMRGFYLAYKEVNTRHDLLPYFHVLAKEVSLGAAYFNASWAESQARLYGPEGLQMAYHGVSLSQNTIGVADVFNRLNYAIPIVTATGSYQLSDSKEYPLYLRTNNNDVFTAFATARYFHIFGWAHTAIIYSIAEEDAHYYECFLNATKSYHIEITNSEANRVLPVSLELNQTQVNATLQEIIDSPTRILVIAHVFSYLLVERMYDLGARTGDFLIVIAYALSQTYYEGKDEGAKKRRQIIHGAIKIYPKLYVGSVGRKAKELLIAADGTSFFTEGCLFYDNAMLVAHALDYMVQKGLHYEDGWALVRTMRDTRFVGCAGRIQIETGSNDLVPSDQVILNLQYNATNDSVVIKPVATYSPFKVQLFNFTDKIQWPNGKNSFSDTTPLDPLCPYYAKDIYSSVNGKLVGYIVCFGFAVLQSIATVLIWKRWWTAPVQMLNLPASISIEDVVSLMAIPVELLVFVSQGPDIGIIDTVENAFVGLTFKEILVANGESFWITANLSFLFSISYIVLFILMLFDVQNRLLSRDICVFSIYWLELLLPSLNNVLFIPTTSILLSHFACFRSISAANLFNRDCSKHCWTGKHLAYSITAAITLSLHVPIAVLTRPLWQELQSNLHLKAQPSALMLKSILQLLLIASRIALSFDELRGQAGVYLILLTCYLVIVVKRPVYNYQR